MSTGFVEIVRELVRLNHQAAEDEYLDTGEVVALADRAEQLLQQHESDSTRGTLDIGSLTWETVGQTDNPQAHLLATVYIDHIPHHLDAYQLHDHQPVDPSESAFWQLSEACGAEGSPFYTVEIEERDYALFLSPFCL